MNPKWVNVRAGEDGASAPPADGPRRRSRRLDPLEAKLAIEGAPGLRAPGPVVRCVGGARGADPTELRDFDVSRALVLDGACDSPPTVSATD